MTGTSLINPRNNERQSRRRRILNLERRIEHRNGGNSAKYFLDMLTVLPARYLDNKIGFNI